MERSLMILDDSGWKNLLIQDFLKNQSLDYANFGNLDEVNCRLSCGSGFMFLKTLDLELWSDL